jgi:hypothetical protein
MTTPESSVPVTAEDFAAATIAEYGQYRATQAIYINGARAFNPGDPVPAGHVKRKVVSLEQVEDVTSKKKG